MRDLPHSQSREKRSTQNPLVRNENPFKRADPHRLRPPHKKMFFAAPKLHRYQCHFYVIIVTFRSYNEPTRREDRKELVIAITRKRREAANLSILYFLSLSIKIRYNVHQRIIHSVNSNNYNNVSFYIDFTIFF